MTDGPYRFQIRLGNFQFEVEGDRNFVERTLTRYEGRFLPRFQQLLDKVPAIEAAPKGAAPAETAPQAQPLKAEPEKPRDKGREKELQRRDNKRLKRRNDRRRPNNRHANNRVMPAPRIPENQEVVKQPYLPPDFGEDDIAEPTPLPERADGEHEESERPRAAVEPYLEEDDEDEDQASSSAGSGEARGDESLRELFDKLQPRTHHEKIMVFGYFLQVQRGMKEFGTGKVKSCYDSVGADPAGNINQVLNHASRTGFVTKAQRGRSVKYSLTSKGRQFIERGLQAG